MQTEEMEQKSRLDSVERITQVATSISIVIGIVVALVGLYDAKQQASLSFTAMRMAQLEPLREMIKKERLVEREDINPFMELFEPCKTEAEPGNDEATAEKCRKRIRRCSDLLDSRTHQLLPPSNVLEKQDFNWEGKKIYYHECFERFKKIGRHYDELGAMVRLGYVDFDFLFTLISFPDDFWEKTVEYRGAIQNNWSNKNDPLNDFWINFTWLHDRYQRERRARR